jgi:tRNA dimethylallyltransferase
MATRANNCDAPICRTGLLSSVHRIFCIVGPTATGKSELAADVAVRLGAEVVNADAFQIYEGFDVLSGKPDSRTLGRIPHHLIGTVSVAEEMSAAKYRAMALSIIADVGSRAKLALVVGGTGLYTKALTHGLADMPPADAELRQQLNDLSTEELQRRLTKLDPVVTQQMDMKNRRRVIRAIEIALLCGRPVSEQREQWGAGIATETADGRRSACPTTADMGTSAGSRCHLPGIFVFRDREQLYERINSRVEAMIRNGAIDEVRHSGHLSATAEQMIGVADIRNYLTDKLSLAECIARIQQSTRRYAKRQLTWFRHQTNFEQLNLSLLSHNEAVEWVCAKAIALGRSE